MDESIEIARLKGQVEAYQDQLRSMSIEVLRMQVERLRDEVESIQRAMASSHAEFGRFQAATDERISKASALFIELRREVAELRQSKHEGENE